MSREQVLNDYKEYEAQGRIWGQVPPERISKIKFPRADAATVQRYLALPDMTTTVSDLLDSYGRNKELADEFRRRALKIMKAPTP